MHVECRLIFVERFHSPFWLLSKQTRLTRAITPAVFGGVVKLAHRHEFINSRCTQQFRCMCCARSCRQVLPLPPLPRPPPPTPSQVEAVQQTVQLKQQHQLSPCIAFFSCFFSRPITFFFLTVFGAVSTCTTVDELT